MIVMVIISYACLLAGTFGLIGLNYWQSRQLPVIPIHYHCVVCGRECSGSHVRCDPCLAELSAEDNELSWEWEPDIDELPY